MASSPISIRRKGRARNRNRCEATWIRVLLLGVEKESTHREHEIHLRLTSLAEGGFGLPLLASPRIVARLLFEADIPSAGVTIGRLTGMCLVALGVACWPGNDSLQAFYGMFGACWR